MAVAEHEGVARKRLRIAGVLARCGWGVIAVSCGIALALAQYASLADGDPAFPERIALVLACGGSGFAILAWLWWALVLLHVWRSGYAPAQASADSASGCLAFGFWLFLTVGGLIGMAAGGDADSTAPLALLALGGGCTAAIAGSLGVIYASRRWYVAERREEQQLLADVRAVATAQGWEAPPASRGATVFSFLGLLISATMMLGCAAIAPWVATRLHSPTALASALIIVPGMLICFPSMARFAEIQVRTREIVDPQNARTYSRRAAAAVTLAFAIISILYLLKVGFLSIIVFIALGVLANRWRRQYLSPV